MTECIFCRIAAGELEADVVAQSDEAVAFRDINAQAPTHVQVIPRKHVPAISQMDPASDSSWIVEIFKMANQVARDEGLDKGYRLVINNGALAGQSVAHVHLHVLGGRQLGWPPG